MSRSPAPLPPEGVAAALRPFGSSRMLPAAAYTSAEVFAWEGRHLLAGSWVCLGREPDLWDGGVTQRAYDVGGVPVLLTRVEGDARALANTCRHRGHELLAAGNSSARQSMVCPYHAWSYALDGSLRAAPAMTTAPGFDPGEHALVELPLARWHGWLFVNASGDPPPFAAHIGALESLVAPYRPETLVRLATHDYDVATNWKVAHENYHECYHCPSIHPELCRVSPPASSANYDLPGAWVGGRMDLREGAETMSLDGGSSGVPLPGLDGEGRRSVLYLDLFPNLLLSLHPDYVMTHLLTPLAAGRTRIECSWYFPAADIDPSYAVKFWDLTNRQDWAACESVYRGLCSPHYVPGPLAPGEDAVHRFVSMVARSYLGGVLDSQ
ncbi:MAG: aromatic ring-hydroxylating dioxygenase subunit alpha [Actinomycetota bacterium]|nr:aromatic ring-hydroxylating dioxygenase subunit alpha [Actinomycetota bacterium]